MKHLSKLSRRARAFTIIELLVVVSIISMMSSVILVAVQNARTKGVVGGAVRFATNNYRGFGDKMSLYLDFNEASGNPIDKSGSNATTQLGCAGASCSNPARVSTSYSSSAGNAMNFPKPTNTFQNIRTLIGGVGSTFVTLPTDAAISVWIHVSPGSTQNLIVSDGVNTSRFSISVVASGGSNPNQIQVVDTLANSSTVTAVSSVAVTDSNWHNVTWTSSSSGPERLYLDGKLVDTEVISGTTRVARNIYYVGYLNSTTNIGFGGDMDDFMIFQQNLAESEVQQIYAQGRLTHPLAEAK